MQIDFSSPAFYNDPYPTYHALLENAPVYHVVENGGNWSYWLVSSYAEAAAALKDARLSKEITRVVPPEQLDPISFSMLFRDPPEHTRLRGLVSQAFTPARVRSLEPRINQMIKELLDPMWAKGRMDFVSDFAVPLPVLVICELLGIPYADRQEFRRWSDALVFGDAENPQNTENLIQEANSAAEAYFARLVAKRRANPQDDLISAMLAAQEAGDRLSEIELQGMILLLLVAGHETTVNLLSTGMLTLLRHPEQGARLKAHPELLTSAVEEMLRFESPVQTATFRVTKEAVEIGGQRIEPLNQVIVNIGAANRDPAQFPDPDRFDVAREPNRHLAFGMGGHFCLGAPLARLEARLAFAGLLDHLPEMHAKFDELRWHPSSFMRGLRSLPVEW